jgi:hypothetical protein
VSLATRTATAFLALIAWIALFMQFGVTYDLQASLPATLWALLWYFTITTNLLVAIVFTTLAAKPAAIHPSLIACTTLNILLVGIIYALLLHGLTELSGDSAIANVLLHLVTPVLVPIFWLFFTPKGHLQRRDPLLWTIYPLGYFIYALIRGEFTHRYPYPFMNVNALGWPRTLLNGVIIAIAFLITGWLFVRLDILLARNRATALPR